MAVAFLEARGRDAYSIPRLQELFDFVRAYLAHYRPGGAGAGHPRAALRAINAARVRFNIETKLDPRASDLTVGPVAFARKVGKLIARNRLEDRADVQSFDFRTLFWIQEHHPRIRTAYLFGDFPVFADPALPGSGDGANLQAGRRAATRPWLAGLPWPYRVTARTHPLPAAAQRWLRGDGAQRGRQDAAGPARAAAGGGRAADPAASTPSTSPPAATPASPTSTGSTSGGRPSATSS